ALPSAVEQDKNHNPGDIDSGRPDEGIIAASQQQVYEFQHYGGNVCDRVLDRVRTLDALVPEKVGQACDRRQRSHHETDEQQPFRSRRQLAVPLREENIANERQDEADDRKWDQHRVNGMVTDPGRAARVSITIVSIHFLSPPSLALTKPALSAKAAPAAIQPRFSLTQISGDREREFSSNRPCAP